MKKNIKEEKNRKKEEENRNKLIYKKYKKWNESRLLVLAIVIAAGIICLTNFLVLLCILFGNNESFEGTLLESSLLSTGLSIIGIAIAVWAGLNIIQILGRNRLSDTLDQYSKLEDERRELYKDQFINELKQQDRASSKYFCVRFHNATAAKDDIPASVYYKLFLLENNYENVYLKQPRKFSEVEIFSSTTLAEETVAILCELSAANVCEKNFDVVQDYLKGRSAELNYNFAYGEYGRSLLSSVKCCKNTIAQYSDLYHLNDNEEDITKAISEKEKIVQYILGQIKSDVNDGLCERYAMHVVNVLADSFSMIAYTYIKNSSSDEMVSLGITKETARKYASVASDLYRKLLEWADEKGIKVFEFIYRNYGVAIERESIIDGFDYDYFTDNGRGITKTIRSKYKEAIELGLVEENLRQINDGVFKVNGSLYINVVGKIEIFSSINPELKSEIELWTDEIIEYMRIAVGLFPYKHVYYKVLGIALTYKLMFIINRHDTGSYDRYYYLLDDVKKKLDLLCTDKSNYFDKDDYLKLFQKNYEKIQNRM